MTIHHYIASKKELPLGKFGSKYTLKTIKGLETKHAKHEDLPIKFYETEEDAIGIYISRLTPGYEDIKSKFKNPFVYEVIGTLHVTGEGIRALFNYIDQNLSDGEEIEIYSCSDGEEKSEKENSLDAIINFRKLTFGKYIPLDKKNYIKQISEMFCLEDKQYIVVGKGV
ncbi:hypothetical protein [Bacillus norwichensis]|uniref:Uncharacterized protein n=1 Tax=Bacillus norwichensis TaxID=2762217 RepID=A0ABR8VN62_9BACI|nr:hypothetical protein [Bacillus norwichensis]MBD8006200.1 hypothetical protein [Bacillus norwichensis]